MEDWKPKVLVLSSGGVKGTAQIGALYRIINDTNWLDSVETIVGTSVGAVIGLFYILGYTPREILEVALETSLFPEIDNIKFKEIKKTWGIIDVQKAYLERFGNVVKKKCNGTIPTLKELYEKTGKIFCTVSTDLRRARPAYHDKNTDPDLSVIDAVAMSANIPVLFPKIRYKESYHVDGALSDPLPIKRYDDGNTPILAIYITEEETDSHGLISYMYRCCSVPLGQIVNSTISKASSACKIMQMETDEILPTSREDQVKGIQLFNEGYRLSESFIHNLKGTDIPEDISTSKQDALVLLKSLKKTPKNVIEEIVSEFDIDFLINYDEELVVKPNVYQRPADAIKEEMISELSHMIREFDDDIIEFAFKGIMTFMKSQVNIKRRSISKKVLKEHGETNK